MPKIWFILHRANSLEDWSNAQEAGLDWVEVDLRLVGGDLECRHDKPPHSKLPKISMWRGVLPYPASRGVLFTRVALRLAINTDTPRLILDIKDKNPAVVPAILEVLHNFDIAQRIAVCSPHWDHLDVLAILAPDIPRFYSLPEGQKGHNCWEAYRRERLFNGYSGSGVSAHKNNALAVNMQSMRIGGLRTLCYTVNSCEEAVRLIEQGAGGIISDNIEMLAQLKKDFS